MISLFLISALPEEHPKALPGSVCVSTGVKGSLKAKGQGQEMGTSVLSVLEHACARSYSEVALVMGMLNSSDVFIHVHW